MHLQVWNDELAGVAQAYAANCMFEFNTNRATQQATFTNVGENIAATTMASVDYQSLVQAWFDQGADYDLDSNSCSPSAVCGLYTQVYNIAGNHWILVCMVFYS